MLLSSLRLLHEAVRAFLSSGCPSFRYLQRIWPPGRWGKGLDAGGPFFEPCVSRVKTTPPRRGRSETRKIRDEEERNAAMERDANVERPVDFDDVESLFGQ